jgi:AcrR family transcriptional regulator
VYEQEYRARQDPFVYEAYMMGAARYLAEQTDDGRLTPEQQREAFNQVWQSMISETRQHAALLATTLRQAEASDAQAWQTFGQIALGLGALLTTALLVAASSSASGVQPLPQLTPPPALPQSVVCTAIPYRNAFGQSSTVSVICR